MDRTLVYPSQQPTDTVWLTSERNKMVALGYFIQGAFGTSTVVDGLTCAPTSPASLAVTISNGSIYQLEPIDVANYGSLAADPTDQIVKQGIALSVPNITLTPPGTSGQAINYLIEAAFSELDTANTVLPYFNLASLLQALQTGIPPLPLSGPSGSGTSQPTIRQGTLSIIPKAGAAATAGSQVTPTPDAGYVGLWVVTVANGATQLTSSQIAQYPGAPFILWKLPSVPAQVQSGTWEWGGTDTGTANQVIVNITPVPATITAGFEVKFQKIAAQSTGAMTIIVNGAPAVALTNVDGSAFTATAFMPASCLAVVTYNGTAWRWTNSTIATATGSLSASAGEGISVTTSGTNAVVALNYPSLTDNPNPSPTVDLWSFFSQAGPHHRVLSSAEFLAWLRANLPINVLTAPQTYYVNPSTGSDLNFNGLTAGTPFATIQKAIAVAQTFNLNGFDVTIICANSAAYIPFNSRPVNGAGHVVIVGNITTPSLCIINSAAGEAVQLTDNNYVVKGFRVIAPVDGSAGHLGVGVRVDSAVAQIGFMEFGPCLRSHILVDGGGSLTLLGVVSGPNSFMNINGQAPVHIQVDASSTVVNQNAIANVSGTLSFTGGFWYSRGGSIFGAYSTINNTATFTGTSPQWKIDVNGIIDTGGQPVSYLPGNSPGFYGPNRGGGIYA